MTAYASARGRLRARWALDVMIMLPFVLPRYVQDNMTLAEAFLKRIIKDARERCAEDMQFFQERIDKEFLSTMEDDLEIWRYQKYVEHPVLAKQDAKPYGALVSSGKFSGWPMASHIFRT